MKDEALHWFAVQAKPASEALAESALRSMHVETLLPRGSKSLTGPPTRAPGCEKAAISGIPVCALLLAGIRERMDADGCVELEGQALAAADGVDIMYGPICGWSGAFERDLSDGQRVVILLRTLEQCGLVVDGNWVERTENA